jgi:hypothetical protein
LDGFAEEIVGKQANTVGKEAKQQLHDKAGDGLVVDAGLAQVVFELCKLLGCLLRYANLKRAGL